MKSRRHCLFCLALLTQACGDDSTTTAPDGAGPDAPTPEASTPDSNVGEAAAQDNAAPDAAGNEAGADAPSEAGETGDSGDGGCPASWQAAPTVNPSIAVPADGGSVLLHASAAGTQNYSCSALNDGGYAWVFVGPEADLMDCNSTLIGHHFASDGGAAAPEWQTLDGTYVIGHKVMAFTPDAGPPAVPWLLLQASAHGGTGTLSQAAYVQRLFTDGGVTPATACDQAVADGGQSSSKVPYAADYYFYGP